MKTDKHFLLANLILGFLFTTFLVVFSINDGFTINFSWKNPFQILDYAGSYSPEKLTSEFIGYIFYFIFGIYALLSNSFNNSLKATTILFLATILIFFAFSIYTVYLDYVGSYTGQHLRARLPLLIFAIFIYVRLQYQPNNFKPTNNFK